MEGRHVVPRLVKCTLTEKFSPINAANLRVAHARLETKGMTGKLVLSGW